MGLTEDLANMTEIVGFGFDTLGSAMSSFTVYPMNIFVGFTIVGISWKMVAKYIIKRK
ncbi:hypothetical protein V7O62_12280 [Methanolobus sp. ZRKC2]|uniref:hypothetical protein n=1 Tax=Methanolobus sp. ZRKC2 TaxID=3125783 RepID=UPI0032531742